MRIKKTLFPLIAATSLFYACSDNSSPTAISDGIAETTSVTTYTCADGTETENASDCNASGGVVDSTTKTIFVCSNGTKTSNADDCSTTAAGNSGTSAVPASSQEVIEQVITEAVVYQEAEGDLKLVFSATGLSVENDDNACVTVDNEKKIATIKCAGNYYLSGSSSDFQVVVAANIEAKVYLYFNGLNLTSKSEAPIYVQSAEKVFFMLVDGTDNKLTDASTRTTIWKYTLENLYHQ